MDINTNVEGYFNKARTSQKNMLKLTIQVVSWSSGQDLMMGSWINQEKDSIYMNSTPNNAVAKKRSDLQKEALLAVKRDPAVLEAKVTIMDQDDVSDPLKALQTPEKPKEFQPRNYSPVPNHRLDFENKMCMERAALMSLSASQFSLILKYVATLRQQRMLAQKQIECAFCVNNKEPEVWYTTHTLKDSKGRVRCPVLRSFVCPLCGATGNRAHTITHCPFTRWC